MTEAETASLAEEIRLLVDMVVERAAPWLEGVIAAGHGSAPSAAEDVCGWCPLCAVVGLVRGDRPEFAARLIEHATRLVALLRAVLADRWEPEEGLHMPGFQPARESKPDRVQHIPVRWRDSREATAD
ncbi:MAG TPA: hypothetical protein VJT49_26740 [Amycolatopsis sp.]|uniref:hypothetical protein n=1 Tax=Amycolatopsis sp. TaxID=37632 RepID=UPI002B4A1870|nr:hypothetical protein [Amycolatopsis sp.]HKS48642.1 hypothetical protein [Amycolatopsis sp.]